MKKKLHLEGMSCMHCVKHVHDALIELNGVKNVNVDLDSESAVVEYDDDAAISDIQLKDAVQDAGYDVISIENV